MPVTSTPLPGEVSTPPVCAPASWAANDGEPPASCMRTSLRWYGWPFAPRVVSALARFSATTSMRSRSADMPGGGDTERAEEAVAHQAPSPIAVDSIFRRAFATVTSDS